MFSSEVKIFWQRGEEEKKKKSSRDKKINGIDVITQ